MQLVLGDVPQVKLDLTGDDLFGDVALALPEQLADTDDGLETGSQSSLGSLVDGFVGLTKILSAFAVTENNVLHADLLEHTGGDLAGESTACSPVAVLGADFYVGACGRFDSSGKVNIGNTRDDFAVSVRNKRLDLVEQRGGFLGSLVHFPVAGDNGFSFCFIHIKNPFLFKILNKGDR